MTAISYLTTTYPGAVIRGCAECFPPVKTEVIECRESRQLVTEPTRTAGEARVFLRAVRGGGREVGAAASAVVARGGDVGFRSARGRRGGRAAPLPPPPRRGG